VNCFLNSWTQNLVLRVLVKPATPMKPVVPEVSQMADSVGMSTNVMQLQRFAIKMVTRLVIQLWEEYSQNVIILRVHMTVIVKLDITSQQTRVIDTFR